MANEKIAKFIIDVSAEKKRTQMSDMRFFSMDHKTAKIVVQAEKDGEMIAKSSISRVEIMLESLNAGYQAKGKVIFNDQMTVDDDGLFSYVFPDELLNYSGLMAFEVYIYYTNGDVSDSSNRIVYEQRVSAIDKNAGQVELVYIKDMEAAKQSVADKADEVMADMSGYESSSADYEHQIKGGMDQLYDGVVRVSTDEITKIRAELPKVQTVATEEIGKIRDVLSTVENAAQEVSDHADQRIAEYDAKFVSTDKKMTELEQSQGELDAELKATQQQIIDADVYTKAEADANAEGILDKRNLSPAWSWSKDGTDRFATEYPGENLISDTLPNKLPNIAGIKTIISHSTDYHTDDGSVICSFDRDVSSPYYFAGSYRTTQIYSDEFLDKIRGKTVVASANIAFNEPGAASANKVGISIYYWDAAGKIQSPNKKKSVYEYERVWVSATIPEDIVNILVAVNCHGTLYANSSFEFNSLKLEVTNQPNVTPTAYTPAPSEDPLNAYPKYKGLRLAPSDNPADYDWSYTDEYVDYLKNSSVSKTEFNDLAARLTALENKEV